MQRSSSLQQSASTPQASSSLDRKSTRLNSSHTEIYTLSLHDALPISVNRGFFRGGRRAALIDAEVQLIATVCVDTAGLVFIRSEEHTSELQSHRDLHSFPTRRSSDLSESGVLPGWATRSAY